MGTGDLDFGPVFINGGIHCGRIGCFDNFEHGTSGKAFVIFGNPLLSKNCGLIPLKYLEEVNTNSLNNRLDYLTRVIYLKSENNNPLTDKKRITYLEEVNYIYGLLSDRMFEAMFATEKNEVNVFLSHSSRDKGFVKSLAVDLKHYGISSWLDEWEISVGESIPTKISDGIDNCAYLILVLSKSSTKSKWVENEWQSKYWEEIENGKVRLLPVLLEECTIPTLLKHRKYANFISDYTSGLEELVQAINKHRNG